MSKHVVVMVGTRPEAVKMASVFRALKGSATLSPVLVSTGQHRELLDETMKALELRPDFDLDVMTAGQGPNDVVSRALAGLSSLLGELRPAVVLTQGDTCTTLAGALSAYYLGVPVGHVEAGLRTYDHGNPFPEEGNRQIIDRLCQWCFAPTAGARDNLLAERIDADRIFVTGNTGVDALLWMIERSRRPDLGGPFVLMTLHRRESFGEPLKAILKGIRDFVERTPEARVVWPVHPNPAVAKAADETLEGISRVLRMPPLPYDEFAGYLAACRLLISDSGGIQEEAPSLGKVVLIARETTERPEALLTGRNRLMGRKRDDVCRFLTEAWAEPLYEGPLPAPNPYGDGTSGRQIVEIVEKYA
jgi:UDP-N-acetylglucosamine 2-epimerase (non-hydrolysing)